MDEQQEYIENLERLNKELLEKIHHLETAVPQDRISEVTKIEALAWRTLIAHHAMPVEIYLKDTQHRFLEANRATLQIHGLQRDELIGKTDADILNDGEDNVQKNFAEEERVFTTGETVVRESEGIDRDGRNKWLIINKLPVKDEQDKVVGLVGVNYDVSPLVEAKNKAISENKLLRSIIDNLPDFIYVKDSASKFLIANQALIDVLQHLSPSTDFTIEGKTDAEFYPPEYAESFHADEQALVDGSAEIIRTHEDGFDRYGNNIRVYTTKIPVHNDSGTVDYIVGIGHDVTYLLQPYHLYEEGINLEMAPLLDFITMQAVEITGARSSGLYRYDNLSETLHLVGETNRHHGLLNTLHYGQGIAGTLVKTRQKKLDVFDYSNSPYVIEEHKDYIEKIHARLLEVDNQPIGVIYVEDVKDHSIDEQRLDVFDKFANYVAQVLLNAQRIEFEQEKRFRLQELAEINSKLISNMRELSKYSELTPVAREATNILQAQACTILLINPDNPNYLVHEASYGYNLEEFPLKKEFKIESGIGTGFTGHIASKGKAVVACGDSLKHKSVASDGKDVPLGACNSILMVPLRGKKNTDPIIGWLRADNKKGKDGVSTPTVCFTETDLDIASLFAEFTFAIIRNMEMQLNLTKDRELLRRVIDNIPDYVYVKDRQRRFRVANIETSKRMGKSHPRELIGKTDEEVYGDNHSDMVADYRKIELEVMESGIPQINFEEPVVDLRTMNKGVLLTTKVPWVDEETKTVLGIIGIGREITGIKKTNSLIMKDDPEEILNDAAVEINRITQADWVTIILADSQLNSRLVCSFPDKYVFERRKVRENGLSAKIINSGKMIFISDINKYKKSPGVNPITLGLNFQTVIGIPMSLDKKTIGVIWLHYSSKNSLLGELANKLPDRITRSLEFYIQQVAIAFDRVNNRRFITQINKAMGEVIKATTLDNYEATVKHIVESICLVSGSDIVTLYGFNSITKEFNYTPITTGDIKYPNLITAEPKRDLESLVYRMLVKAGNNIIRIPDAPFYKEFEGSRFVADEEIEACLVIRFGSLQNEKLGIIFVSYRSIPVWKDNDIELINLFAQQAAVVIQNDINYQQIRSSNDTLSSLNETIQTITNSRDQATIHSKVAESALKIVDNYPNVPSSEEYISYIGLLTGEDESLLEITAAAPKAKVMKKLKENNLLSFSWRNSESAVAQAIRQQKDLIIRDLQDDSTTSIDLGLEMKSEMVILLEEGEKILGIIGVESIREGAFTNIEKNNLKTLANQLVIALSRIRHLSELERSQSQLRVLQESTKAITVNVGKDNLKDLLDQILLLTIDLLNADKDDLNVTGAAILDYDEKTDTISMLASTREDANFDIVLKPGDGLAGQLLLPNTERYIIVSDYNTWDGRIREYENRNFKAMMGVSLELEGKIVGVLNVNATNGQFTSQDAQILLKFADHVVIAMNNHEKLMALEASFNTLSRLWKVAYALRDITILQEPNAILELIANTVKSAFKCDLVIIYPYNNLQQAFDLPIVNGKILEDTVLTPNASGQNSSAFKLLKMKIPYLELNNTRNILPDHMLADSKFIKEQQIISLMAIPLRAPIMEEIDQYSNAGVMFVNYRSTHQFVEYERQSLKLVADHAANVIYNARRFADLNTDVVTFSKALTFWDILGTFMMRNLALHNEKGILAGIKADAIELANQQDTPEMIELAHDIASSVNNVLDRINDAQQRTVGEKPKKLSLTVLLDRVLQVKIKTEKIEVAKEYKNKDINTFIEGYKHTIIPIFLVIIQNAVDELSESGGKLTIDAQEVILNDLDAVQISFADNGSGVPLAIRDILTRQIIESEKNVGTGSGLYLARHLMALCHGELKFRTCDEGTTFFVTFLRKIPRS